MRPFWSSSSGGSQEMTAERAVVLVFVTSSGYPLGTIK